MHSLCCLVPRVPFYLATASNSDDADNCSDAAGHCSRFSRGRGARGDDDDRGACINSSVGCCGPRERERSRARSRSRSRRIWDPHRRPPRARKPEQAGPFGLRVKIVGDPDDGTYLLRKSAFDVACWDSMIPTPRCVNLWSKTAKQKARRKREEQRASARGRAASWKPTADSARSQSDTRTSKPSLVDLLNTSLDHPLHRC